MPDSEMQDHLDALERIKSMLKGRRFGKGGKTPDDIGDEDEETDGGGKLPSDDSAVSVKDSLLSDDGEEDEQGEPEPEDDEDESKHSLLTRLALASVKGPKKR